MRNKRKKHIGEFGCEGGWVEGDRVREGRETGKSMRERERERERC